MFGLEADKPREKPGDLLYDFEKEVRDPARQKELKKLIEERVAMIKKKIQAGQEQEEFERLGILLMGYTALTKVALRASKAKK